MRHWLLAPVLLAGAAMQSIAAWAGLVSVRNQRGVEVVLAQPAQRVVSLLPSLTESVCTLGACDRLVGVDRYSNHPASVRALPQLGGGMDPNLEAIVALRPDLVLAARSTPVLARLQALGLRVAAFEPQTHEDVHQTLLSLGSLLGLDHAERVWAQIQRDVQTQAARLTVRQPAWRVYFEVNDAPYAAGPPSFIGQTLQRLGLGNVVPDALGPFPRVSPEFVLRADPDIVMVGDVASQGLRQRPGWPAMRALRLQRLCVFTPQESDVLVRPGPRLAEAAALMVDCVRKVAP